MLKFGIVAQINPKTAQAKVQFAEDEHNSFWLPVLQTKTMKDKFYAMPDQGEQVVCLMDENWEDGVILGAIYSSEDKCPAENKNEFVINFEDGSFINYSKGTQTLVISCKNIHLLGDIFNDGVLKNTLGISSDANVADGVSTMQTMRDKYNPHTHVGNLGNATSKPNEAM